MEKDELFMQRIKAEILAEMQQVSHLMDEYRNFTDKYSGHMDTYLLRVKASFMADFYMGMEKTFGLSLKN